MRLRHRVGRQQADAKVVAGAGRAACWQTDAGQAAVEAARAAVVVGAGDVVAAHAVGQGQVGLGVGADPLGRQLERPHLGRAEMLNHLGAGARGGAAVKNAGRRMAAHRVGVRQPPLRAFAARLVQLQHAIRLGPAKVQRDAPARNDRPHAVMHPAAVFGLVKTQVQPAAQVVARLRNAARDAVADALGQRVRRAGVVGCGFLEKCAQVAKSRKAYAQHMGVGGGEHHLVEALRIEAVFQAYLRGVRRAGKRIAGVTPGPGPVGGGNGDFVCHLAALILATARNQFCLGGVQAHRLVGHRVGLHQQALRCHARTVDDTAQHLASDGRAAGAACHRHL